MAPLLGQGNGLVAIFGSDFGDSMELLGQPPAYLSRWTSCGGSKEDACTELKFSGENIMLMQLGTQSQVEKTEVLCSIIVQINYVCGCRWMSGIGYCIVPVGYGLMLHFGLKQILCLVAYLRQFNRPYNSAICIFTSLYFLRPKLSWLAQKWAEMHEAGPRFLRMACTLHTSVFN